MWKSLCIEIRMQFSEMGLNIKSYFQELCFNIINSEISMLMTEKE